MNGVIKNKRPFLLIGLIIFLFSCEKTELNEVEELIGEILPKKELYKESYLNQSSGISFTWSDIDRNVEYITNMIHSDLVQWYGNGQSYHDVNNDGYEDILVNPHNTNEQTWFEWYINQGDNKTYVEIRITLQKVLKDSHHINLLKLMLTMMVMIYCIWC